MNPHRRTLGVRGDSNPGPKECKVQMLPVGIHVIVVVVVVGVVGVGVGVGVKVVILQFCPFWSINLLI
jgi:hypothetical protein